MKTLDLFDQGREALRGMRDRISGREDPHLYDRSPRWPNDGEIWLLRSQDGPKLAAYDGYLDAWRDVNLPHCDVLGSAVRRVEIGWYDFETPPKEADTYPPKFLRPLRRGKQPPLWPWHVSTPYAADVLRVDLTTRRLSFNLRSIVSLSDDRARQKIASFVAAVEERWTADAIRWTARTEHVPGYLLGLVHSMFDTWASRYFGPEHSKNKPMQWSALSEDDDTLDFYS